MKYIVYGFGYLFFALMEMLSMITFFAILYYFHIEWILFILLPTLLFIAFYSHKNPDNPYEGVRLWFYSKRNKKVKSIQD